MTSGMKQNCLMRFSLLQHVGPLVSVYSIVIEAQSYEQLCQGSYATQLAVKTTRSQSQVRHRTTTPHYNSDALPLRCKAIRF